MFTDLIFHTKSFRSEFTVSPPYVWLLGEHCRFIVQKRFMIAAVSLFDIRLIKKAVTMLWRHIMGHRSKGPY
jgi:hypothetical protein